MIQFNSSGMSEEELIDLSKDNQFKSIGCMEPEFYGLGREIRHFGYYPQTLPIYLSSEHGLCLLDYPQSHNLNAKFPYMLVHSERMRKAWSIHSKIPCFIMQSPFVTYRRRKNMNQSPDATGTLAFFGHSTKEMDITLDINRYIKMLKNLPDIFQPVSICMHFVDIQKGYYKPFLNNSYKVYTAGNWLNPDFMFRFYEILRNYKFSMSNIVGSYLFYSVEMGIPFSKVGEEPKYYNNSDTNNPLGNWNPKIHENFAKTCSLFDGLHYEINPQQKSFVESELGIAYGIGRLQMAILLYLSLLKYPLNYILNHFLMNKVDIFKKLFIQK